ncbi:hypothetical protein [Hyalangium versicolor]|uniref:hypothetical protein n=1 Tax=Hyalangium versicolor TaxID=2861190 RepID=UPI001CCF83CE|nr:hypothetical protein [Hyalangium versicolor]
MGRTAPALAVVTLYEGDDDAAAERWLSEFEARSPDSVAIVIKLPLPRPLDKPPFWIRPSGSHSR